MIHVSSTLRGWLLTAKKAMLMLETWTNDETNATCYIVRGRVNKKTSLTYF